ncbi:cilia- and flagella-associated protein 69-like [Aulostomus maculatus]
MQGPEPTEGVSCSNTLELTKVTHLLEDHLTANSKERHLFVLKKLLRMKQNGFLLRELAGIARIVHVCTAKGKDHPEYLPVLCEVIKICRLPFLKEKASDELNYAQDVIHFLSHVGRLVRLSDAVVRQQLLDSVESFFSYVTPKQQLDGLQPTSPGYRLQLLERSDLAETLLLSTAALQNQPAIRLQLLHTLQILSCSSDMNCASMLRARGAETICLNMNEPDPSGQVLFCSSEILWDLLERGGKDEVIAQLSSVECVLTLEKAFFYKLLNSSRHADLQLRNDLLAIVSLIAENHSSLLIQSLFAREIIAVATFPELRSQKPLTHNLKLLYNNEDFKMKKMLLSFLVLMAKDLAAVELYKEERVMLAVMQHAASSKQEPQSSYWSSSQQEDLRLQALVVLASIAPLMLDDFMACEGSACLLPLLDYQGHSSASTGGRGSEKARMKHCMRVLRAVTSVGDESANQDLCLHRIIHQLLGGLMQMEGNSDEEDVDMAGIKSDMQLVLSALCESDVQRKQQFGLEGVEMVFHFLRKGSDKFYSGLGHNKLILSTVGCVWSCIVGCHTTEDYFMSQGGVFLLLDLLSSSPRCVQGPVLATLLDMTDNPNTSSRILCWKDDRGETAPKLLLQLWRDEEAELGVGRSQHGEISDPWKPILHRQQQEEAQPSLPAHVPGAVLSEVSENLRAKIYSIFCKLGFQELPGLSTKDLVTLSIVKRYLEFKVGEQWDEISHEMRRDGVRPITPDNEALTAIAKIAEDVASGVIAEQKRTLEQREEEAISVEELKYSEIKFHQKQRELAAEALNPSVSWTSNCWSSKEEREQREKYIEANKAKAGGASSLSWSGWGEL